MAMTITEITKRAGGYPKRRRVGRGEGSGLGKTSGRGHKGEGSRSGGLKGGMYEGGVFPLFRRVPKLGFNNANFRVEYQVVNLCDLEARFDDGAHVTAASLFGIGLIRDLKEPVKILGDGEMKKKLVVEAQRFSVKAAAGIEKAGGTVKRLGAQPKKKFIKRPAAPKPKVVVEGKGEAPEVKPDAKPEKKKGKKPAEGADASKD
jgi:large subunit ribosomal protein L15